ncbi:tRNA lysidine(34) synthetase TilS [Roseibium marinum]|uniref:tRNA(Ile)-lysidine synthase n=1 Tax=Roseibium marinum TaxID=281252 RepID=A0A2S3UTT5_9HYPH|nr:tRNA lysidine(34) synthetase TilS [Roseibium marinum]POF31148.1 tRNA(Ile)-lysidine synthase [Roseibium marinum]
MSAAVHNVPDGPAGPPVEHSTLPDEDIDFLFRGLNSFSKLALAVSGGADSSSLLVLFGEWMKRTSWQGGAEVVCVDHGLRPESAAEADFVAAMAADHGLPAKVLRWEGEKPTSNIQEEARQARYLLIAGHMRQSGAQALVLAHHLDDQAETFLDRLTRGSGLSGLGAMACDETDGPQGLRLLRPLLSVPKTRLEASLRTRGLTWCSDPSNLDLKYKRSRLRAIMSLLAEEGLTADRLAQTAGHLRRAREALETTLRDLVKRHVTQHPAGPLTMSREVYRATAKDLRLRLLTGLAAGATGRRVRIRFRKLEALDLALLAEGDCRHTLAGALFDADRGAIRIWKEAGRTPPETLAVTASPGVWDNRYRYWHPSDPSLPALAGNLRVGPLCRAPVQARDISWPEGWPKEAFDCSPVVWTAEGAIVASSLTAHLRIGNSDGVNSLNLERIPFQGKLEADFVDGGDLQEEI